MSRAAVLLVVASLFAGGLGGCGGGQPATPQRLVIAAGVSGDVYRVLGEALGEAARRDWGAQVEVRSTSGSIQNIQQVAEGRADVGFATIDAVAEALAGNLPFAAALPIQAVARLYDDYLQVVVLAGSEVEELADLDGRVLSVGRRQSGVDISALRVLHAGRVTPGHQQTMGPQTAAQALTAGEIDAFVIGGGLPTPVLAELANVAPVRLLSLQHLLPELQRQYGEYYRGQAIPAGTYGNPAEVETISVPNVLIVRQDLPAGTAYRLTELLFRAKPELVAAHVEARKLDHRTALATMPIALHEGARRYYRDAKPRVASATAPAGSRA